jgi:hypothetical protein
LTAPAGAARLSCLYDTYRPNQKKLKRILEKTFSAG